MRHHSKPSLLLCTIPLIFALATGCDEPAAQGGSNTGEATTSPDATSGPSDSSTVEEISEPVTLPDAGCTSDTECTPSGELPPCQRAACIAGACTISEVDDGTVCDDGDACTSDDSCAAGQCAGEPMSCDDENPCTTDACDPQGGCVRTNNQRPCDDGDSCTLDDRCFLGECAGEPLACDDANPCTEDSCEPGVGCAYIPRTGSCDDGDECTVGDACINAECIPGPQASCGESSACMLVTCDSDVGCINQILDGECDDGDSCTDNDQCKDGTCLGESLECDDNNPCTSDSCSPTAGCLNVVNSLSCDDGDPCTLQDSCSQGMCVPGPLDPLCCDDASQCDDGDPCTEDFCLGGYCAGIPIVCDDGSPCTSDVCEEGECVHSPYGPVGSGTSLSADFEGPDALAEWTVTSIAPPVTWQLDSMEAYSGVGSLYCGDQATYSYDTGAPVDASISTNLFLPPGDATLSFWVLQDVAEVSCTFDVTTVLINGTELEPKLCQSIQAWTQQTYSLSDWAGSEITLSIRFSTEDSFANTGQGVWIDDLVIESDVPEGCCLIDADCGDPSVDCQSGVCDSQSYSCAAPAQSVADARCDDEDPCTADTCPFSGSCLNTALDECTCTPACATENPCGDDGCGGSCGSCEPGSECTEGQCTTACVPACATENPCGDDGCGGSCGSCNGDELCEDGVCIGSAAECTPECTLGEVCVEGVCEDDPSTALVTFNVDMNCSGLDTYETVYITGPFVEWCADCRPLADDDNDGVWSATYEFSADQVVEYKYQVDAFTAQEDLVDDMLNGGTCAPVTDYSAYANREIIAAGANTTVTSDVYGSCFACDCSPVCDAISCGPDGCGGSCGACGDGANCEAGQCVLSCAEGLTECSAACVDLLSDTSHCGDCDTPCSAPNGTAVCDAGACGVGACNEGYADCNQEGADGCETPTTTTTDCGSCGSACAFANATASCETGTCSLVSCSEGYGNCNESDVDGCEVNYASSALHCGSCDNPCADGQACNGGICQ